MADGKPKQPVGGPPPGKGRRWDAELAETLMRLFYEDEVETARLASALEGLESKHGEAVYSEIIHLLAHLEFEPREARRHWERILSHHHFLESRIGKSVDVRVAMVSYFLEVAREYQNPTIIEMHLLERTEALAYRDELTGLRNYRFFREYLSHEIMRCGQYNSVLSLIMIDVDDFKDFNDQLGHQAGNRVLQEVGRLIEEASRKVDVVARYGGEEFAVLVSSTTKAGAMELAERARRRIEEHFAIVGEGITISLGVAAHPGDATTDEELIRRADLALYGAKTAGKNRSEYYDGNRRSFRRVPIEIPGTCLVMASESRKIATVDLSEGGARFVSDRELPVGSLVEITLDLPDHRPGLVAAARVVFSGRDENGRCQTAVRLVEVGARDRYRLRRFLAARDRR